MCIDIARNHKNREYRTRIFIYQELCILQHMISERLKFLFNFFFPIFVLWIAQFLTKLSIQNSFMLHSLIEYKLNVSNLLSLYLV